MSDLPPQLIVVGGPNGAGKSTFVREALESKDLLYLCADEAAFELCPEHPESVAAAAGRLFLQRIREARDARKHVIIESTLSGKSFRRAVKAYADAGYEIGMIFVTPLSPDESVRRVSIRVKKGGHNVPEIDIRRRFGRAHANFWNLYRTLATRWKLYYNETGGENQLLSFGRERRYFVASPIHFEQFNNIIMIRNMSERTDVFSERDNTWFSEVDAIMQRAVQKAVEENRRLGLDDHQPDGREEKPVASTVEDPK